MQVLQPLTNDQLVRAVPAIGAEHPAGRVSGIYKQVRTLEVVDILRDQGWMPVMASAPRVRSLERGQFCKHMIKFQREGDFTQVEDERIQLLLTNSHDAGSCYHVMLGVFRMICSNGMVVQSASFQDIRIRHVGFDPKEIVRASSQVGEAGKLVSDRVSAMRAVNLEPVEQSALSRAAGLLLFEPDDLKSSRIEFNEDALNAPRRYQDRGNDLWHTFNRIQENAIKGIRYYRQDQEHGRYAGPVTAPQGNRYAKAKTHQIKSIDRDIRLNQALWTLAEEMLKIKTK
jgi:hypothetical protein